MKLYGYFRSSASYRVRIALNLKGIAAEYIPVNLLQNQQSDAAFRSINPQGMVPALALDDGQILTQSLAIMEYLEETHPQPPLLPHDATGKARVRALAETIACDIAPLNVLRILRYLQENLAAGEEVKTQWYRHWIAEGFAAVETMLANHGRNGGFCYGDTPTLADICLIPQVFNAERFDCDLNPYPRIRHIAAHCNTLSAFINAHPANQPDATA